jgi:hypothetical protein
VSRDVRDAVAGTGRFSDGEAGTSSEKPILLDLDDDGIEPSIAAAYAARAPTRYEHLEAICVAFGIRGFTQPDFREMSS